MHIRTLMLRIILKNAEGCGDTLLQSSGYYIILYHTILYQYKLYYTILHYAILLYDSFILYYIPLHYITLYYTTLHYRRHRRRGEQEACGRRPLAAERHPQALQDHAGVDS